MEKTRQPRRPHYIEDWANFRALKPADIARAIGADKSLISRWYSGATPSVDYQAKLSELFNCEPESLFRHPDDDWLTRFFRDRSREEIERAKAALELMFPKRTGTDG